MVALNWIALVLSVVALSALPTSSLNGRDTGDATGKGLNRE